MSTAIVGAIARRINFPLLQDCGAISLTETIEAKILRFVASRPDGTTCPSEIARSIAQDNDAPLSWRGYMPSVHETVDGMIARGEITLTWKSSELSKRAGPYRISAGKPVAADDAHAD